MLCLFFIYNGVARFDSWVMLRSQQGSLLPGPFQFTEASYQKTCDPFGVVASTLCNTGAINIRPFQGRKACQALISVRKT